MLNESHREINYKLCAALDLTLISIVLDRMVEEGMDKGLAMMYENQCSELIAALRAENNKLFI